MIEHKDYYSNNGQIAEHYFRKDGMLHGEYKDWYNNGQLWEHSFYKDGKPHGESKLWVENGNELAHRFYQDGKDITDDIVSIVSDIKNITPEEYLVIKLTYNIPLIGHSND